jgi:hypothetical protein
MGPYDPKGMSMLYFAVYMILLIVAAVIVMTLRT